MPGTHIDVPKKSPRKPPVKQISKKTVLPKSVQSVTTLYRIKITLSKRGKDRLLKAQKKLNYQHSADVVIEAITRAEKEEGLTPESAGAIGYPLGQLSERVVRGEDGKPKVVYVLEIRVTTEGLQRITALAAHFNAKINDTIRAALSVLAKTLGF